MAKVSVYIIAYNEADKIEAAVRSVLWADEIVVADSGSTDGTAEKATALGARVVQIPFEGFGKLRNDALTHCTHEWIFSLDSDERCTPEARDAILAIVSDPNPAHDVWRVPRRNWFMGRWIKGSGWYPDFRQPQLFRQGVLRYTLEPVHEGYEVLSAKPVGTLAADIWQVPFKDLGEIMRKADRYSTLGAPKLAHKKVSMGKALSHGAWAFIRHYVLKGGFRDGWAGFVIALGNFQGTFLRYAKRVEQTSDWAPPAQPPLTRPERTP